MTEADRIRAEIEAQNEKMKEHMNFVSGIVAKKTVGPQTYKPVEDLLQEKPVGYTAEGKA